MRNKAARIASLPCAFLATGAAAFGALAEKPPTAERHKAYRVDERTKKLSRNPHKSHYGEVECNACHRGHEADESLCAQCHQD